jgi:hypothetical protein
MELKEVIIIIFAAVLLGLSASFPNFSALLSSIIYFFIIIIVNVAAKKIIAYHLEADAKIRFWEIYQYYWTQKSHFKKPVPMLWLAPVLSLFSMGYILWLAILEFDVQARPERISRRHGFYRYTEMTDWHIGSIAAWGVIANLILAVIVYILGFGQLAKFSIYFSLWSLLPIGSLDGTKILFGSRILWMTLLIVTAIFFSYSIFVV